ncbi:MAG TPA: hypothetical protein VG406_05645 [Isosphaeraceae bacterium]|jgi:hypothetical protein|nr:hypothetical protein [Isosphaeraceae bacterium]
MVPDYYAMLGIEPGVDRATIEAALAKCQPAWSSGTRNPKNKHTFQSYLDQIPALRQALLGDPSTRAAYDAELAAARRAERERKLDELQRLVRLRAAKGGLTVADRALLLGEATRLGLTEADLDRLAQPYPEKAPDAVEDDPVDPTPDVVDPTTRRQIRLALEHLRRRDLYDVLDLPRDAPTVELLARADAERQRWMQKSQVTAEKTAWLEAVSYAQSHLGKPDARARYDRTLTLEAEEALLASMRFVLDGVAALDSGTRQALIDEGTALGVAPDRASRLIRRACRAQGVAIDGGGSSAPGDGPRRLLRCRSCSGLTDFADAARPGGSPTCRHCDAPLQWECPVCRRSRWVDEPRCACGFPLELREPLLRHLEASEHAYKTLDFDGALAHLRRVQELAPQHRGARKGVEKVKEKLSQIEAAKTDFETEQSRQRLVAAQVALERWGRLVEPGNAEVRAARQDVARRLRDAAGLVARARPLISSDPKAARELLRQCLATAADLPEAIDALRRCPPDPPTTLHVATDGERVLLRWAAPHPDGLGPLSYRVVRRRDGVPAHAGDGNVVAEVKATEFEDRAVNPGESVGYAVFSRRHDADSLQGASAGPYLVLGEVADVRVEVGSREVHLAWQPPRGAVAVRVVRRRGVAPAGPDDGDAVEALRDSAHDRDLEDDRVYHYGLFALYRVGDHGALRASRGVLVSAMPHAPAEVIDSLQLATDPAGGVRVSWREPKRGQVRVVRTSKPLDHAPGDRLSNGDAERIDGRWLDVTTPGRAIDPSPPTLGVSHYTPLISWAGTLTVGRGRSYSSIPDPADLRAARMGSAGQVRVKWRWKPPANRTRLLARAGVPPTGPDDPEATAVVVTEDEYYNQRDSYTLTLPASSRGPWHLAVFGVATLDGHEVVSAGLDPTARAVVPGPSPEVTVSYSFHRPGFPGRPWSVTFRTEPPGSPIPPTALVAHARTAPLSADDGEIVDRFPAARDGATFRVRPGIPLADRHARVFPDPLADPGDLPPIRLRHPETGGTRV